MENKYKYLSAGLLAAGVICLGICFTNNTMPHLDALSELSGVLMIAGLLMFFKKQKKSDGDAAPKSGSPEIEVIARCEKILSDVHQQIYGDDDNGKEEISFFSEKLGKFIYRRKPEWYEAVCVWCGTEIKVTLGMHEDYISENYIRELEMIFDNQKETNRLFRKMVRKYLDDIKDKGKCPDDLLKTKSTDFAKRIFPCNLYYDLNNGFFLNYSDDVTKSDYEVLGYLSKEGSLKHVLIENAVSGKKI